MAGEYNTTIYPTGELSAYLASGTGITLTTGHASIASISYADGAAIEAALTGGAWDDLVDINLGVPFEYSMGAVGSVVDGLLLVRVASNETNGDYLRMQIEIDGVTVLDFTNTSDNTNNIDNFWRPLRSGSPAIASTNKEDFTHKMFANSRLRIRAWKNGTFDGASYLYVGEIDYNKLTV